MTITVDDQGNITVDKLGKNVKKVGKTVTKESKKMQSAWAKSAAALKKNVLGLASFTAAMFAVRGAVKTVLAFEDAMAEVSIIVDTNTVNMKALNSEILDLSTRVPKDAESLAQGLYQTISAGVTDVADAMIVLESSSKAATAGLTSTFVAVDAGTTIMNAYGKTVEEIDAIQDVLFNTVKEGKTKYDSLATSIGRAAPIAAQVGVSFEELTAAAATLTKGGLSTEEAMTSIRAIMVGILKPTTDAEILAKKLGLQFDSEGLAAKGLGGFLEEVTEKTGGNTQAITALFGNVRALTGVMALAGKQAGEFKRIIESNTEAAGAMNEAFLKVNETVTSQWQIFKNQWNKVVIESGEIILPTVVGALKDYNDTTIKATPGTELLTARIEEQNTTWEALTGWLFKAKADTENLATPIEDLASLLDGTDKSISGLLSGPKFEDFFKIDEVVIEKGDDLIGKAIAAQKLLTEGGGGPAGSAGPTEQQKALLEIKEAILNAEKKSKLTQMAINQLVAERIANAKSLFGEVEKIGELFTEEGGIVSGMKEWQTDSQKTVENMAKIGIEILPTGVTLEENLNLTKHINENFSQTENKIKGIVTDASAWNDSLTNVLQTIGAIAQQISNLRKGKGKVLSGLGALAGLGVSLFNPVLGGQIIAGSGIAQGLGFQHGGQFTVGGTGGADSQVVAFRATPGEEVNISTPGNNRAGNIIISPVINVTGGGLTEAEITRAASPGIDLIATGVKRAISARKLRRSDLDKAV